MENALARAESTASAKIKGFQGDVFDPQATIKPC
jgi:hypothetical protein